MASISHLLVCLFLFPFLLSFKHRDRDKRNSWMEYHPCGQQSTVTNRQRFNFDDDDDEMYEEDFEDDDFGFEDGHEEDNRSNKCWKKEVYDL